MSKYLMTVWVLVWLQNRSYQLNILWHKWKSSIIWLAKVIGHSDLSHWRASGLIILQVLSSWLFLHSYLCNQLLHSFTFSTGHFSMASKQHAKTSLLHINFHTSSTASTVGKLKKWYIMIYGNMRGLTSCSVNWLENPKLEPKKV